MTAPEPGSEPGPPPAPPASASAGPPPVLTRDGRDASRVPADWAELIDPGEWRLNEEGLPARSAARVIALRRRPVPAILLVIGHDFSAADRSWGFTPGGGIMAGESPSEGAARELAEETGIMVDAASLIGPVVDRSSRFSFNLVTCRQDELFYLARLDAGMAARADAARDQDGQMDRSGWTPLERDVLDSLRWWPLDELDAAVGAGMVVHPQALPALARRLLRGWDGKVLAIREEGGD